MDIKDRIMGLLEDNTFICDEELADLILNLPVSEERMCDNCEMMPERVKALCIFCNGTGKLSKTLKQLIEEARNG